MTYDRKLILYIAMSLDGFIADENESIEFLNMVAEEGQDYGYTAFTDSVDTVIMGRKTYEAVRGMGVEDPHPGKETYILTSGQHNWPSQIKTFNGNVADLLNQLRQTPGKSIYCDGGAEVVRQLRENKLIDEYIISVIPIILGNGVSLFGSGIPAEHLSLVSAKSYAYGLVQLHYVRRLNHNH